jgi:hypothetical protein
MAPREPRRNIRFGRGIRPEAHQFNKFRSLTPVAATSFSRVIQPSGGARSEGKRLRGHKLYYIRRRNLANQAAFNFTPLLRSLAGMLLTTTLAARRLGVPHERLLGWVARQLLPIAGEDEEGRVLLNEHILAERGEALMANAPDRLRSPRLRRLWASLDSSRVLPCGCVFASGAGPDDEPLIRCVDARALDATSRLTEALAASAPDQPFFQRLAEVTRGALTRHLAGAPTAASIVLTRKSAARLGA